MYVLCLRYSFTSNNKMFRSSKSRSQAAGASAGLSLLSEAEEIRDRVGRNESQRGRPARARKSPTKF